jgi:hypothetical protein
MGAMGIRRRHAALLALAAFLPFAGPASPPTARADELPVADGYRGVWYMNMPTKNEWAFKYSGGFATYPQQHVPIALYAKAVDKTFLVFGGTTDPGNLKPSLLMTVGVYDHKAGTFARPRVLLDKQTTDAHDNPTLSLDDAGRLYVFCNAHGRGRPSYVYRSSKPYDIAAFDRLWEGNFSYGQPWHLPAGDGKADGGFLLLHTRYEVIGKVTNAHNLFWMTSPDGAKWTEPQRLATFGQGHYQVSWLDPKNPRRVGTAFDFHPGGLDTRTNLYYLETNDGGKTWQTAGGTAVAPPLLDKANPALVGEYETKKRNVYLKDLQFDPAGRPIVLFLTSKGPQPGPENGPYEWQTARWTGSVWEVRPFTTSDHNYDHGSLYVSDDGAWTVIAPTDPGPAPYATGGEMVVWTSKNQGGTWLKVRPLTHDSPRTQTYLRRPLDASDGLVALWADGDARKPSASNLYFTDRKAEQVWRLPETFNGDTAKPEPVR